MTYDCMTPDELTLWREGSALVARTGGFHVAKPCADCPLAFRLQEYAAGRCRLPKPSATPESREYKREWMRRYRERQQAATIMSATGPELSVPTLLPGSLHS